jgi:hypothetical protein
MREAYYWRKDDFDSLKRVSEAAERESAGWQDYADFCLKLEKGLRHEALLLLERFIVHLEREPFIERRRFVKWLMGITGGQKGRRTLLPHPLVIRIIEPTLLEWVEVHPEDSEPHRWIGDPEHLEKAIELDPTDHIAAKRLVIALLSQIDYATHELPFGYLGIASEDFAKLARIEALLPTLANDEDRASFTVAVAEERGAIEAYLRRQNSRS